MHRWPCCRTLVTTLRRVPLFVLSLLLPFLLLWLAAAAPAQAQSIESVLSPGKLVAGHAKWQDDCAQCHVKFDRAAQDRLCAGCHKDIGQDMRARTGYHGRLKAQTCRSCHTEHKGATAQIAPLDRKQFDHKLTDYPLRGKHLSTDCDACHTPGRKYSQASAECDACHRKDDVHKAALGPKCQDCHTEANWKDTRFDHAATRFALSGKHADVRCADCHRDKRYADTPRTCIGCHKRDDDGSKGHKGQFGERCDSCHNAKAWKPSVFNHDSDTKYALRGKHRSAACGDCHRGPLFKTKLSTDCVDCHRSDDKHKGTLGKDCGSCHTERDWKEKARFDHDKSRFPLLGKHRDAKCDACHKSALFKEAPRECIGCHLADDKHQGTLGRACADCHGERDWKTTQGRFDHERTQFPLRNAHLAPKTRCDACHKDLRSYRKTPQDCVACHRKDDKHQASLGERCADCHSDRDWKTTQGRFDHGKTRFPLRNAHAAPTLRCDACHRDARSFRNTAMDCISCHRKDDKHEGQLSAKCETCHSDIRWKIPNYDHARTRFPLTGRHLATACGDCHRSLRYRDAARECSACHQKDDKHKGAFGAGCDSCHNARAWSIWRFDHDRSTSYKLEGPHRKLACETCHSRPAPKGQAAAPIGSTCVSCHRKDDVHDGGFGARCEQCHGVDTWRRLIQRTSALGAGARP